VRCASWSSSARGSMGALGAGATPSSSWPMPSCAPPGPSDQCPLSASSPNSVVLTAVSTRRSSGAGSTRIVFGRSSWRSARRRGHSSLPSTPRPGIAVTPSAAPSEAFTTRRPSIRRANPSWPAGTISGSVSWTGPLTRGRHPSTWSASRQSTTAPRQRQHRSGGSFDSSRAKGKSRCSSSTLAITQSPSVTIWPKSVANVSPASATTASFSLTPLLAPADPRELVDVLHGTDGGSSARIRRPGRDHQRASLLRTPVMAGSLPPPPRSAR
jgi:hypothetical protein